MSFQEKSLWLLFVSLIGVFGTFFATAIRTKATDVKPEHIGGFVGMIVLLVILQIVGAIAIAIISKILGADDRHEMDERDRLIGLKGTRNGSYVLAAGVFASLTVALMTEGNFLFTHLLLGFWVLAQLVETGSQLVMYRRGA